jgi:hypothetical protein
VQDTFAVTVLIAMVLTLFDPVNTNPKFSAAHSNIYMAAKALSVWAIGSD